MTAGRRELERASCSLLSADVGEVGRRLDTVMSLVGSGGLRLELDLAAEVRDRLRQVTDRDDASTPASAASCADSAGHKRRSTPSRRAPSATASTPPTRRSRPSSASSPTAAVRASAARGSWSDAPSTASAIGKSKPEPSFRSSAGARLTVMRPSGNFSSAAVIPLRTALTRLLARPVGETDDREAGNAVTDVRLDIDTAWLEADQGMRERACEHAPTVGGKPCRERVEFRASFRSFMPPWPPPERRHKTAASESRVRGYRR